ncbi:MAG: hypothetical protein HKN14_04825 [Marinicaulis sp.]|nr:hypothetical protein [Marinicaulis sp.]
MGIREKFSGAFGRVLLSGIATGIAAGGPAISQDRPVFNPRTIDLSDLAVLNRDQIKTNDDAVTIDFEGIDGQASGAGILLTTQYRNAHGVHFGDGASVHRCGRVFDDVNVSLCPYAQAASGANAAAHEVRSGGDAMELFFDRPVSAVSMRINPTGGATDEFFVAQINGFNAAGDRVIQNSNRFSWTQGAVTWPTSIAFDAKTAQLTRVTVELRRVAANNRAVRFLIDDLSLRYAPESVDSPVFGALNESRQAPQAPGAEVVQSPEDEEAQEALRIYPAARRIRTKIDWDAAEAMVQTQNDMGLTPAALAPGGDLDRATLPVLLPQNADGPVDLATQTSGDSFSATFKSGGRMYDYYGTRVMTVVNSGESGGPNITLLELEYGLGASFNLFGASYRIVRYCENDNAEEDAACLDKEALGEHIKDVVVALGEKAGERP